LGDFTDITDKGLYRGIRVGSFDRKSKGKQKMELVGRVDAEPDMFELKVNGKMNECLWISMKNEDGKSVSVVAHKQILASNIWNKLKKVHENKKNRVKMFCTYDSSQPGHPHSISVQNVEFLSY
jgi:hypothetical protein